MTATLSWDHNLGPLTTTAVLPTRCTQNFVGKDRIIYQGQTCSSVSTRAGKFEDETYCWPDRSGAATLLSTQPPLSGWGYYSPGLICPAGYTTACEQTGGSGEQNYYFQFSPSVSETAYGCCPKGFVCSNYHSDSVQNCVSFATSTNLPAFTCSNGIQKSSTAPVPYTTTSQSTDDGSSVVELLTVSTLTVCGPLIQIVHRDSDIDTVTETGGILSTATTVASSAATAAPVSQNSHSLSDGAIVGITVSVVILSILIGLAAYYCLTLSRNRRDNTATEANPDDTTPTEDAFTKTSQDAPLSLAAMPTQEASDMAVPESYFPLTSSTVGHHNIPLRQTRRGSARDEFDQVRPQQTSPRESANPMPGHTQQPYISMPYCMDTDGPESFHEELGDGVTSGHLNVNSGGHRPGSLNSSEVTFGYRVGTRTRGYQI